MIHVCFILYDNTGSYSKFTGTAMCSIFENASVSPHSIIINILHDSTLSNDNRDKFIYLAGRYNQLVEFYNVEKLCSRKISVIKNVLNEHEYFKKRFSIAAMYRFLVPTLLPANAYKAIYLDSDIIVNLNIKELWQIELHEKPLGAVTELSNGVKIINFAKLIRDGLVKEALYLNSGVLLMNLKVFREEEENILRGMKFIGNHPEYKFFDQDVLNYCFANSYLQLPVKFNRLVKQIRQDKDSSLKREIYHYADIRAGLGLDINDPFNRLWMNYFTKTPWFNLSTIYNFYKKLNGFGEVRRNLLITLSATMSGKTRVFVIDDKKVTDWLKRTYFVRDDEEIFIYEDEHSLQNLIDEMNISHGKKIFFIRVNNQLIESLKKAGFIEDKDFFNHYSLFSSQLLEKIDIHSLIKAM